jgi:hypothetical protein
MTGSTALPSSWSNSGRDERVSPSSGLAFVLEYLGVSPDATLEQVRSRAQLEGRRIHAATYRRARVKLGLDPALEPRPRPVPLAPAPAPRAAAEAQGGSRSARMVGSRGAAGGDLDDFVRSVEGLVAQRDRLRGALVRIRDLLERLRAR